MDNKVNKIREQRKSLTYSVRELAILSNVPERDIKNYEANKKKANVKTIEKIARATNTNVSDWVNEEYFQNLKIVEKCEENLYGKDSKELLLNLFIAMNRADNVIDILLDALMEMKEICKAENDVIISEFARKLCTNISSIKFKKVLDTCGYDADKINKIKNSNSNSNDINVEMADNSNKKKKNITYNNLLAELKIIFKKTDVFEVIIQALINTGYIDSTGYISEKAELLLNTIISNKVKRVISQQPASLKSSAL